MTSENAEPAPEFSAGYAELARLEEKLATITDPDIRAVLQLRIQQLRVELPPPPEPAKVEEEVAEPEVEEPLLPPSPEQMEKSEAFVRQAKVEKMRGNTQAAADLMRKAAEAAPTAPAVLEALGDDAMARHNYKEARAVYEKAIKVSPKSINLERKHAEAVLRSQSGLSIEQQLRLGLMDTPFLAADDITANKKAAVLLTAIVPGVGQITLGQTKKGITILALWIACWIAIILLNKDLAALLRSLTGHADAKPTMVVLIPILGALILYFIALADLKGNDASRAAHKVARPKPPVDLPYE